MAGACANPDLSTCEISDMASAQVADSTTAISSISSTHAVIHTPPAGANIGAACFPLPSLSPDAEAQCCEKDETACVGTSCESQSEEQEQADTGIDCESSQRCKQESKSGGNDIPHSTLESLGYAFTEEISQVNHGVVQLATHQSSSTCRCVKVYFKSELQSDTFEFMKSEADLMFTLGTHPRIGEAIEIFQDAHSYFLSMPYYSGGNLVGLKAKAVQAGVVLVEDWWTSIFRQCLDGLAYMHAQGVMHCDIKEPNVMLRTIDLQQPDVVIIDLGVAQRAATKRTIIYGTPGYIPPEVWECKYWYPQSDMFSLGVVVVQALIGKTGIFTENTRTYKEVFEATRRRPPPFELMPHEFPALQGLAQKLLMKNFQDRPSASSMLERPWQAIPQECTLAKLNGGRQRCSLKPFRRHNTLPAIMVSSLSDDLTSKGESPVEAESLTIKEQPPTATLHPLVVVQESPPSQLRAAPAVGQHEAPPSIFCTPAVLQRPQKQKNSRRQLKKQLSFAS